jgi:hypothetical protein
MNWKRGEHCIYRAGSFAISVIFANSEISWQRAQLFIQSGMISGVGIIF